MSMAVVAPALTGTEATLEDMSRTEHDETRLHQAAKKFFPDVWRFLRRLGVPDASVDDAAQEVFLVAIHRFAEVRPGAEKSYLFGTAVRVAHVQRRKHAREELVDDPDDERGEPVTFSTPEDAAHRMQEHAILMSLLDGLPDDLRTVFVLFEIEGESITSIASALEIPQGTVASRLRRAREKFELRLARLQSRMRGES